MVADFHEDVDLYGECFQLRATGPIMREMKRRHVMRKVSNQQLIAGFGANAWVHTYGENRMDGPAKQRGNTIAASTLSDEMIGTMKNT